MDVERLLADYHSGMTQSALARKYGVSQSRISQLLRASPDYRSRANRFRWPPERESTVLDLYASGLSIGLVSAALQCGRRKVRQILRRRGVAIRPQGEAQSGHYNPSWKGGRTRCGNYWYTYRPDHPAATIHGYVAEHRLAAEKTLGRLLTRKEVVHHIDGDPSNNDPGNLRVFASNADHLRYELTRRVPKWSEEGRARILEAVRKPRRPSPSRTRPRTGDPR